MVSSQIKDFDYVVVGGGFYGCCLALFLRSISDRVLLVEASDKLLSRASRVNQARVHTGFHYPRSAITAVKSMLLHRRFLSDFSDAVVDDYQMVYAVASRRSKVNAKRFYRMFRDMGAPIEPASPSQMAFFNDSMIEAAFSCVEVAFDYSILAIQMTERLTASHVEVRLSTDVKRLVDAEDGVTVVLSDASEVSARYAFNVTYSQLNRVLKTAGLPQAHLKHEIAELALVEPPPELSKVGITVMDGPFFSFMPYPSRKLHSLTHVRYTPHEGWSGDDLRDPYTYFAKLNLQTRYPHMLRDAKRYVPSLTGCTYRDSIFDVKTVLVKNEHDDGRPILYQQVPPSSRVVSILGGKIDNIYDLFDLVNKTGEEFSSANDRLVTGN